VRLAARAVLREDHRRPHHFAVALEHEREAAVWVETVGVRPAGERLDRAREHLVNEAAIGRKVDGVEMDGQLEDRVLVRGHRVAEHVWPRWGG
jgi:hypothetical protein